MTAPSPRPTREQVDATLRVAVDGNGDRHDARLLAAEVRALRAELDRVHSALRHESDAHIVERSRLRAALAAHTPHPAETGRGEARPDPVECPACGAEVWPWRGSGVHLRADVGESEEEICPVDPAVLHGATRQADADLDGRPLQPVTESLLVQAGEQLHRAVAAHDHPMRQAVVDVADWLRGQLGDPGSGWPVRAALAVELDGEDVPARLDAAAELAALRAQRDAVLAIADGLDQQAPSRPSAPVLAARIRTALGVDDA